jgi:hypothetical protein
MKTICVYLGASIGHNKALVNIVRELGKEIASRDIALVYGGSECGLMGLLGNTVLENKGNVTGIICKSILENEAPLAGISELVVTETIQERKLLMQEKADAFIVIPGGLGTLEEAIETMNSIKVGTLDKPIAFLNLDGFFDKLLYFISDCQKAGFISSGKLPEKITSSNPSELLDKLEEVLYSKRSLSPTL